MIRHGKAPFLECSSKGDKRFSAFYAIIAGKSIEERYQAAKRFADGTTGLSWREAKGKRAVNADEVAELYDALWQRYINEHPELLDVLVEASGLSDQFGQEGHACQATSLWRIRQHAIINGIDHVSVYKVLVMEENERHRKAIKALDVKLEYLQRHCDHKSTSFEADPAGDSSESTTTCNACGKVL